MNEPPKRPRFQFRLRTLMIVVTLLAVPCGWAVDHFRLVRERDEAREAQRHAEASHERAVTDLRSAVTELYEATHAKRPVSQTPINSTGMPR